MHTVYNLTALFVNLFNAVRHHIKTPFPPHGRKAAAAFAAASACLPLELLRLARRCRNRLRQKKSD
jgi:hypothetical protein